MNARPNIESALASQRVAAHGRLSVAVRDGRTRVAELYQEGAAKIRLPRGDGAGAEAVLINTAGGLTGGDRLDWRIAAGEGSRLTVTTQACERIYKAASGEARVGAAIRVGAGGRLAWLPQETILFDRAALARRLDVELGDGAEVLVAEAVLVGRQAHGETVALARFHDRWRVRAGSRLVHAEDVRLGPDVPRQLAARAGAGGGLAFASVLLVGERGEALLAEARDAVGEAGGASFWRVGGTGKLLARLVAEDGYALRRRLVPLLSLLNGQAPLPKLWSL
ncbi:MAG: urease accessory protein UreD [Rhizobiales bacterium]|nr:urease accessory protein UreD [Hyphomicrobiales bacterium]